MMVIDEGKYILVFESYNQAMLLYNALLIDGCDIELISTPCRISRGCSQSIVFVASDIKKVVGKAKDNKVVVKDIYKIVNYNGIRDYVHI